MICKKYSKHNHFEVIIPDWIIDDINYDSNFYNRIKNIISKYYGNWNIKYSDGEDVPLIESDKEKKLYLEVIYFHSKEKYLFL